MNLTIAVPAVLATEGAAERARMLLILDAVRSEIMSWHAAATALRVAPDQLLDLAREHGIAVTRCESVDLVHDLATLTKLGRREPGL